MYREPWWTLHLALAFACFALATVTGCATPVAGSYAVSPDAQVALQELHDQQAPKMKVGQFAPAAEVVQYDRGVRCRGLTVDPPIDRQTFTRYVQLAFFDELRMARLFDEKADIEIDGTLTSLDESSTGDAAWTLGARFVVKRAGQTLLDLPVVVRQPFESSFAADSACQNAAQAFPSAVQQLVQQLVRSPAFKQAVLSARVAQAGQ